MDKSIYDQVWFSKEEPMYIDIRADSGIHRLKSRVAVERGLR